VAAGIEELDYFTAYNADASDATFEVGRRRQCSRNQDNVVAHDLHSSPGILVNQFCKILSQKMQQAFDRNVSGLDFVGVYADVAILCRRE